MDLQRNNLNFANELDTRLEMVVSEIRESILRGSYQPGDRMPTRAAYEKHLGASTVTLQRAFDQLMAEGFIKSRGRLGTFVAPNPPHLTDIAVLFPHKADTQNGWTQYFKSIHAVLKRMRKATGKNFPTFYGGLKVNADHQIAALRDRVRDGRLAGLISVAATDLLEEYDLIDNCDAPMVSLSGTHPEMYSVSPGTILRRGAEWLANRGRKKIGLVLPNWSEATFGALMGEFRHQMSCHEGLTTDMLWHVGADPKNSYWVLRDCRRLALLPEANRPDGMIILDDNLCENAVRGLVGDHSPLQLGDDLDIIAHANFPHPTGTSGLPVERIGTDVRQVIGAALECIDRVRSGEIVNQHTYLDVKFEHEITT